MSISNSLAELGIALANVENSFEEEGVQMPEVLRQALDQTRKTSNHEDVTAIVKSKTFKGKSLV